MVGFFKKYLNYLLTGSFSIVFAACYGAPMELENPKLLNLKDNNNNAIPGLKVTLYENRAEIDEQYTGNDGSVEFYVTQKDKYLYKAVIEDIDGEENLGKFKTKEVDLTQESFFELNLENE